MWKIYVQILTLFCQNLSAWGGFAPWLPTRGSAAGPRWGLCPHTPVRAPRARHMSPTPVTTSFWCKVAPLLFCTQATILLFSHHGQYRAPLYTRVPKFLNSLTTWKWSMIWPKHYLHELNLDSLLRHMYLISLDAVKIPYSLCISKLISLLFQSHRSHHRHHHCHQSHYGDLLYRRRILVVDLHKKSACTSWCSSDDSGYKYNCPEHIPFCNHMTEVPWLPEQQVALLRSQCSNPHLPCTIHYQ